MLIGEYQHNIDVKGRMMFPARLREDFGESFVLTKGFGDQCLFVYSKSEWERIEARIKELPMAKARELQRFLFSSACLVEPDKQGRILIPQSLREYAGIKKDVMVIGASVRAEIWDKDYWDSVCSRLTSDYIVKEMDELGF